MNLRFAASLFWLCTGSAVAQNPAMKPPPVAEWPGAEIVDGVAFQGDGSVTLEAGDSGLPVLAFWRPVLFNEESRKPIAGRMDCKIVAADGLYSEADFDPDARHAAVAETRERQGFLDQDALRDYSDTMRQLDIVGRRIAADDRPSQMFVLTYLMVRDGPRMIDIRRNCTFVHGKGISRPEVLPYVYRYTKISFNFVPNAKGIG